MVLPPANTVADEISRVRLERFTPPRRYGVDDLISENSESEPESDVTAEDPGVDPIYEVDAIKWAKYQDSRKTRTDGYVGWHYGVMWKGYLKSASDTVEPLRSFEVGGEGQPSDTPLVDEFWKSLNKKVRMGKKEPGGKMGELYETPKDKLKAWLKGCRPRRDYETYKRRRAKELAGLPITKADSDYYWYKKYRKERAKAKLAADSETAKTGDRNGKSSGTADIKNAPSSGIQVMSQGVKRKARVISSSPPASESLVAESSRMGAKAAAGRAEGQKKLKHEQVVSTSNSTLPKPPKPPKDIGRIPKYSDRPSASIPEPLFLPSDGDHRPTFGAPEPGIFDSQSDPHPAPAPVAQPPPIIGRPPPQLFDWPAEEAMKAQQSKSDGSTALPIGATSRPLSKPQPPTPQTATAPSLSSQAFSNSNIAKSTTQSQPLVLKEPVQARATVRETPPTPLSSTSALPYVGYSPVPREQTLSLPQQQSQGNPSPQPPSSTPIHQPVPAQSSQLAIQPVQKAAQPQPTAPSHSSSALAFLSNLIQKSGFAPRAASSTSSSPQPQVSTQTLPAEPGAQQASRPPSTGPEPPSSASVPLASSPSIPYAPESSTPSIADGGPSLAGSAESTRIPGLISEIPAYKPYVRRRRLSEGKHAAPTPAVSLSPDDFVVEGTQTVEPKPPLSAEESLPATGSADAPANATSVAGLSILPVGSSLPAKPGNTEPIDATSLDDTDETTTILPSKRQSPPGPKPAERPLYQQPKKIKTFDSLLDPDRNVNLKSLKGTGLQAKVPGTNGVPRQNSDDIGSKPQASSSSRSVASTGSAMPLLDKARAATSSVYAPRTISEPPLNAPTGPSALTSFGARPPTGPLSSRQPPSGPSAYNRSLIPPPPSFVSSGPTQMYNNPPAGPPPLNGANAYALPPTAPMRYPQPGHDQLSLPVGIQAPAQPFPLVGRYNELADPRRRGIAASAQQNPVATSTGVVNPMPSPLYGGSSPWPNVSVPSQSPSYIPRYAGQSPLQGSMMSPNPAGMSPAQPGQSPMYISMMSPNYVPKSGQSPPHRKTSGSSTPRIPSGDPTGQPRTIASLTMCLPVRTEQEVIVPVRFYAFPSISQNGVPSYGSTLERLLATNGREGMMIFPEEMDRFNLDGSIRCGARVIEWAKATHHAPREAPSYKDWEHIKRQAGEASKIYVSYTEPLIDERITCHYAIVLVAAKTIDPDQVSHLQWQQGQSGLVALLLAIPLTSDYVPELPNPVKPDLTLVKTGSPNIKPKLLPPNGPNSLLESYGLDESFLSSLHRRAVQRYPGQKETPTDHALYSTFLRVEAINPEDQAPEIMFLNNTKIFRTLRSSSIRTCLGRRTRFYAFGPALQLPPAWWGLKQIWNRGGLVTFSPTFILRSPDKFGELMGIIRTSPSWDAYIIPAVVEWASLSRTDEQRCPNPGKAMSTLTNSLFLDHNLLALSGSKASSGGGLAVSVYPPSPHLPQACGNWLTWLRSVVEAEDFLTLVQRCRGVRSDSFEKEVLSVSVDLKKSGAALINGLRDGELTLEDIEIWQLKDLVGMRARPHVLPYRRYIHIGEMALSEDSRRRVGAGIEFVKADDFTAVLSGSI